MKLILLSVMMLAQFGPRPALTPAETLLEPEILRAIRDQSASGDGRASAIPGADTVTGDILITCLWSTAGIGDEVVEIFGRNTGATEVREFVDVGQLPLDPFGVSTTTIISDTANVSRAAFVAARGGEDLRVPARVGPGRPTPVEPPTAFLKFTSPADIVYELGNFIDGKRSISDIRDAVSAEFGPLPLPSVVDYFDRLAKSGAITIR